MNFIQVWLTGYINPGRFVNLLEEKTMPHWGFYAQALRSLMDSLLIYLPLALWRRSPSTAPYLTLIPTEDYYAALVWITPLVFLAQWLLGASMMHLSLRLLNLPGGMDRILNVTGMASLVIGSVLVLWDWIWILAGGVDQYFLGISHLVIDIWWFILVVTGLKKISDAPTGTCILISLVAFALVMPLAVIFMRAPF